LSPTPRFNPKMVPSWMSVQQTCTGQVYRRAHQCDLLHPVEYLSKYNTHWPAGRGYHRRPSLGRNAKGFYSTLLSPTDNILKNYRLRPSLQRFFKKKGKAVPLEAWSDPEDSRFHDNGTGWWSGCQPYAPTAFPPGNTPGTHFC